jgi:hypothetical protein
VHPVVLVIVGLFLSAAAALWAIALVDVVKRPESEFPSRHPGSSDRNLWTFVVLLGNVAGSLAYYVLVIRPHPRSRA